MSKKETGNPLGDISDVTSNRLATIAEENKRVRVQIVELLKPIDSVVSKNLVLLKEARGWKHGVLDSSDLDKFYWEFHPNSSKGFGFDPILSIYLRVKNPINKMNLYFDPRNDPKYPFEEGLPALNFLIILHGPCREKGYDRTDPLWWNGGFESEDTSEKAFVSTLRDVMVASEMEYRTARH